jgi:hypothetical protein
MNNHINNIHTFFKPINNSGFLAGAAMIMLNIGSKYIELGLTKTQEQALRNGLARELLIFSMTFIATKDVILALFMTIGFSISVNYLFNENSTLCILPNQLQEIALEIDRNKDNKISQEELDHALNIIKKSNNKKKNDQQAKFVSYLRND